jgi:CRP-like cAMP-binding protein
MNTKKVKVRSNAKRFFLVAAKTVSSTYWAVTIPLRIAFFPDFRINSMRWFSFIILDLFALCLFLGDAIQSYKHHRIDYLTGKLNRISPESFLVSKPEASKSERDVSPSFLVDENRSAVTKFQVVLMILASFPFEYLSILWESTESLPIILLMNRVLLVTKLPKYLEELSSLLEEVNVVRNVGIQRALKLFFAMALVGHWCSCGFFLVSKLQMAHGVHVAWVEDLELMTYTAESVKGQSDRIGVELVVPVHYAYIQSLYWAYITMITTGFGDIVPLTVPETVWCVFSMSIGVIISTCAIANLQLVVTNVDAAFTEFQHKMDTITRYMRYRRLPKDLQNRIITFYRYQWDILRGVDEEKIMNDLPMSLQQQVANFMCRDLIASLPILRGANAALLNALADFTQINIYSPNDFILKTGDPIKGAIIVARGEIEVLCGNQVERKMKRQDHFGAESLFKPKLSDRTLKSYTFSEVFLLPSDAFLQAIHSQCDSNQIMKMEDTALLALKSESKVNKLFGSGIETMPLNRYQRLLHPDSLFCFSWDMVKLFGFTFYLFSLPIMLMKYLDGASFQDSILHFILSYLIDAFFVADAYLGLNLFMYYEEGLVIFEKSRIRQKYLIEHDIFCEVIALLPLDFLSLFSKRRYQYIFRLTKLLRLKNFPRSLSVFERAISDWKLEGSLFTLRIVKLNLALLITCHWVGCLWHGFANIGLSVGYDDTWLQADESDSSLSIDHSDFGNFGPYLRSVYWAIVGMSTVGYGDIVPVNILETTFATIVILFGGLILPAIVGGLAAYLGNMNGAEKIHRKNLSRVKQYMRHRSIRKELIDRVVSYHEYLWSRQGSIDEDEIMNELPLPLRQSVAIYINKKNIISSPFQYCDDSLKESIALAMKPRIFLPTDTIIKEGEVGTCMFFIERGNVVISSSGGMCLSLLNRGMYFGESALLLSTLHSYSAIATTFCDVFELGKDEFHDILSAAINCKKKTIDHIKSLCKRKSQIYRNILMNLERTPKFCCLLSNYELTGIENVKLNKNILISPDSIIRTIWSVVILLIIAYNCWVVPFHLTFGINASQLKIDFILDLFLLLDMVFHFCLFATRLDGEIISDLEKVKRNYIRNRLRIDAVATFPYDFLFYVLSGSHNRASVILSFLRVPKLLWIARLPGILDDVFRVFEGTDIRMGPLKLIEFLIGVMLMAHWAACGFYALAKWKDAMEPSTFSRHLQISEATKWDGTWIKRQIMNGKLSVDGGKPWQQYIRAFNWALPTLVVVVIGDVVPVNMNETLYAFIWMIVGVSVNAAIIGNVANIVANIDSDSSLFAKKAEEVKRLMSTSNVSIDLQSRIESFISSLWLHRDAAEEESFISRLPETLQIQVTEHSRQWHIRHCPFFDFCSFDIVKTLSLRLESALFSSGDVIVHYGDMGHEMFFLERGTVEVLAKNNQTVFATLSADNECGTRMPVFFGETSLFFKTQRQNTVRAITFCEVYILVSAIDFKKNSKRLLHQLSLTCETLIVI